MKVEFVYEPIRVKCPTCWGEWDAPVKDGPSITKAIALMDHRLLGDPFPCVEEVAELVDYRCVP